MQQFWGASTIRAIANLFVRKTWSKEALLKDWWFPNATRNTFPAIMNIVASTILHTQLKPIQSVMLATVITCSSIYDSERGSHITDPKSKGRELHWIERKVYVPMKTDWEHHERNSSIMLSISAHCCSKHFLGIPILYYNQVLTVLGVPTGYITS